MRLLDTGTGEFVEKDPRKDVNLKYAILSHTWDPEGEQTYQVLRKIQRRYDHKLQPPDPVSLPEPESSFHSDTDIPPHPTQSISSNSSPKFEQGKPKLPPRSIWDDPELSPKIREACAVACANGYQYIWIDSCCIDKTSSAELSEAINSMYAWYAQAEVCYAYLADVPPAEDHRNPRSDFRTSVWFTRGWTLQELIAPLNVLFLSGNWAPIGPRYVLADLIQEITGISEEALLHVEPLDRFSVAQRLSWASDRETTRVEDQAYSLLGIFDINMPTLYGEGNRAFRRLQEEIMQRVPDQSLFAWGKMYLGPPIFNPAPERSRPVSFQLQVPTSPLAMEPRFFAGCHAVSASSHDIIRHVHLEYVSSPYGIRTEFQMLPLSLLFPPDSLRHRRRGTEEDLSRWYLAILGCQHAERPGHLLGRVCYISSSESGVDFVYPGYVHISPKSLLHGKVLSPDLFPLPPEIVEQYRQYIQSKTVYISHPDRHDHKAAQANASQPHRNINLVLLTKTREALRAQGYTVDFRGPENRSHCTGTHSITLSHDKHDITVEFQHTLYSDGHQLTITAQAEISGRHVRDAAGGASAASSWADPSTVTWTDSCPWRARLGQHKGVKLNIGGAEVLILRLRLDLICAEAYLLHVEILASNDPPTAAFSSPIRPLSGGGGGVVPIDAHGRSTRS